MFNKRFRFATRDKKAICFQLVIPVIALLLGLILLKSVNLNSPPSTPLNVHGYNLNNGVRLNLSLPYWGNDQASGDGVLSRVFKR